MLRVATEADAPIIQQMVIDFWNVIPSDIKINPKKLKDVVHGFFEDPTEKIFILSCDDNQSPRGLIGGVAQEFLLNRDKVATEIVWWMDPEYRGKDSLKLIDAFEHWAKHIAGCSIVQMSLVGSLQRERISKMYARRGYKLAEQSYIKVI